jgi:hypothetical protein
MNLTQALILVAAISGTVAAGATIALAVQSSQEQYAQAADPVR